jgi:Holliday junction resolvase
LALHQGIDVHEVHRGVSAKRNRDGIEVDLLVVNDNEVVAIECKSTLSIDDVSEAEVFVKIVAIKKAFVGNPTKAFLFRRLRLISG